MNKHAMNENCQKLCRKKCIACIENSFLIESRNKAKFLLILNLNQSFILFLEYSVYWVFRKKSCYLAVCLDNLEIRLHKFLTILVN